MFLRNCWYVAAWDHEIEDRPLGRILLNEPVVLYRKSDGTPVALENRCCHRHAPLSLGTVVGDHLQCGYHGLVYDPTGACVNVPVQSSIPPTARVRCYPVVERWKWIWIWMGDPALADESLIPNWFWMDHPDWRLVKGKLFNVKCNFFLIMENLLDLSHLTYVHADTIGHPSITRFPIETERTGNGVRMTRWILDAPPPPMFAAAGGFTGNVDRWQISESTLPCYSLINGGAAVTGSGAPGGDRSQGIEFRALNCTTPETARTTHQFYAHSRNFGLDDPEVERCFVEDFVRIYQEDITIMEGQQQINDMDPEAAYVDITMDAPALHFKRRLEERIAEEEAARAGRLKRA